MATLSEAIDGSRSELENITNTIVTSSDDKDSLGELKHVTQNMKKVQLCSLLQKAKSNDFFIVIFFSNF